MRRVRRVLPGRFRLPLRLDRPRHAAPSVVCKRATFPGVASGLPRWELRARPYPTAHSQRGAWSQTLDPERAWTFFFLEAGLGVWSEVWSVSSTSGILELKTLV